MPECLRVCVCVCVCVRFVSQTWMYNIKSEDWAGKDCSPPRSDEEKAELQKGRCATPCLPIYLPCTPTYLPIYLPGQPCYIALLSSVCACGVVRCCGILSACCAWFGFI